MKIELAENQYEITLGQYQEVMKLADRKDLDVFDFSKRKVKIFTGLNYKQISLMKYSDLEDMIHTIDKALNTEVEFQDRFEMSGVEFGFIPNFDDIKAKEYFDLSTYDTEVETLHKLMAILFRPIKDKSLGNYEIKNYQGTKEWSEAMRKMPLNIVNGALVFFLNLANDCKNYTQRYMQEEQEKVKQESTLKSGDGMQRFTEWRRGKSGGSII